MTSFRFPFLVSYTVLLVACGGNVTATSSVGGGSSAGGGGSAAAPDFCASYCAVTLAHAVPPACVLPDPEAASSACVSACRSSWSTCDASEQSMVACCHGEADGGACSTPCFTKAAQLADEKCLGALTPLANAPVEQCTNGMSALGTPCGVEAKGAPGTPPTCSAQCSTPGSQGSASLASASCTATTAAATTFDCTCTAGKATSKSFTYKVDGGAPAMGASDCLWLDGATLLNACNL